LSSPRTGKRPATDETRQHEEALADFDGGQICRIGLEQQPYRVRYCANGMDAAVEQDTSRHARRCLDMLSWPAVTDLIGTWSEGYLVSTSDGWSASRFNRETASASTRCSRLSSAALTARVSQASRER
jgi:hypothetical protein